MAGVFRAQTDTLHGIALGIDASGCNGIAVARLLIGSRACMAWVGGVCWASAVPSRLLTCLAMSLLPCRMHPSQMTQQRTSGLQRSASLGAPHNWGYDDDALLAALVVEYGYNWHFIADTCSSTCVLQVRAQPPDGGHAPWLILYMAALAIRSCGAHLLPRYETWSVRLIDLRCASR